MKANKTSRIISMILVIAMVFTMTGISAFADHSTSTDETKNLLVLGASTSSGYGVADFINENCGFNVMNNYLEDEWAFTTRDDWYTKHGAVARISNSSYPWQLKKYIEETENVKVDLSSMCLNGMRTDELRALLDEKYYEAVYQWELRDTKPSYSGGSATESIGFLTNHIRSFVYHLGEGGATVDGKEYHVPDWSEDGLPGGEGYKKASAYTKAEIENADVIVLDACMNNFGTYMAERISGDKMVQKKYAENYHNQKVEDIPGISETTLKLVTKFKDTVTKAVPMLNGEIGDMFLDTFLFCYADCVTNFSADVQMIRELNPHAKIIVFGVYNTLDGINATIGGQEIPFGDIAAKGFDMMNLYIKGLDKNSNYYYYADMSGGIQTFMDQILSSDSFEELMEEPTGEALMENLYNDFKGSFLPGDFVDDPALTYNYAIKPGFASNNVLLKNFDDLEDDEVITGKMYMTEDGPSLDPNAALTRNTFIDGVIAQAGITREIFDALPDDHENKLAIIAGAKDYYEKNVAPLYAEGGAIPENWEDSTDYDAPLSAKVYLICTGDSGNPYYFTNVAPGEEGSKDIIYLTKKLLPSKENIQRLLYAGAKNTSLDFDDLMITLGDMGVITEDITKYMITGEMPRKATMDLLQIVVRFVLFQGVGQHPSQKGCKQMTEDAIDAYDKAQNGGNTAYEDQKEEIAALMDELKALLDNTPVGEDIDKIIETLDKIEAALPMLDEAQMTLEEINAIKAQFYDYYGQALDLLGITEEDLINQGKFIAENVDWEQLAEWIKKMNEIAQKYPVLREKYEPIIREYADEIYDFVNKAMDEIIKAKDKIDVDKIMEYIQTAEDIIDQIEEVIKNAPTEDEIREKLEELQKIVEEKVKEISEELYEQLKAINEQLKEVVDGKTYEELLKELQPIMDQVKEMGIAIYKLPEYEKIIDEYAEVLATLGNDSAELKDEVSALLEQVEALKKQTEDKSAIIARLTAKAIDAEPKASVKFPKNTVKVVVSWDKDADAAGYEFKVNGKAKEFKETETGFTYEDTAVKIGTTYKYEVTPYVEYEGEKVYGMTFKTSVVPKVKLKKASIKKLKASSKSFKVKWKKVSGASGYKVSYKLGKKTKNKTVKSGKKVSLKVKKLTSGKTYTVKVRAWKKVNGKKYYGKWSKAKKVTVK